MNYCVKFNISQNIISCNSNKTILDAALEQNLELNFNCKTGKCHNCSATILSGSVKDKSGYRIDEGQILTCCTYPQSDLVLNIDYSSELSSIKTVNLPCKITEINCFNNRFFIIKAKLPPNSNFKFLPGQYVNLNLKGINRSFSIASYDKTNNVLEFQIKNVKNGAFSQLLNSVDINQLMRLEGPYGNFYVRESNAPILLVAGGTGFAPIQCIIDSLIEQKRQRKIFVYWRMQNKNDFYSSKPNEWMKAPKEIKFIPFVSLDEKQFFERKGDIELILRQDFKDLSKFEIYVCGSENLIQKTKKICKELGMNSQYFYTDYFIASGQ
jgi:CDP-4-dehydro-6-deoxyglucose reductase